MEPQSLLTDIFVSSLFNDVTEVLQKRYFEYLKTLCSPWYEIFFFQNARLNSSRNISESINFVNTSMHGVSDKFVAQAFQVLGFPLYIPVLEQQHPDPDFPSVKFPNPEEKVMNTAYQLSY